MQYEGMGQVDDDANAIATAAVGSFSRWRLLSVLAGCGGAAQNARVVHGMARSDCLSLHILPFVQCLKRNPCRSSQSYRSPQSRAGSATSAPRKSSTAIAI